MKEDDNIEKFFKDRLNREKEFDFQEGDWDKMESKLDAVPTPSGNFLDNFNGLAKTTTIVLSGVTLFYLGWFSRSNIFIENESKPTIEQPTIKRNDIEPSTTLESKEQSVAVRSVTSPNNTSKFVQTDAKQTIAPNIEDKRENSLQPILEYKNESVPSINTTPSIRLTSSNTMPKQSTRQTDFVRSNGSENITKKSIVFTPSHLGVPPINNDFNQNLIFPNPERKQLLMVADSKKSDYKMSPDQIDSIASSYSENKQLSSWTIGVSIAPDVTTTSIEDINKLSGQVGILAQFHINEHIGILSGLYYSKKTYVTAGENYIPPKGFWIEKTNSVVPDQVEGYCPSIDIPIGVIYTWNPKSKLKFSTGLGMSNYILLSESYDFIFNDPNPGAQEGWATENNSRYFMGLINISVGVSWNINQNSALSFEPYAKIPFKDFGFGNVPLYSWGTMISYRYRFGKHQGNKRN